MKKIGYKIMLLSIICCIIVAVGVGTVSLTELLSVSKNDIKSQEASLRQNFDTMARYEVETTVNFLQLMYDRNQAAGMSIEESKLMCADYVRNLKYNVTGYFWVDTSKGINVVLLGKPTEGTDRYDTKDSNGKMFVHDFISNGMNGGGYTDYTMPKPDQDPAKFFPKRSYTLAFAPFDWVVGTGNYVDDIDVVVSKSKKEAANTANKIMVVMIVSVLISLAVAVALSMMLGRMLSKPILRITALINKTASFDLVYDKTYNDLKNNKDEIGVMANALLNMRSELRGTTEKISLMSNSLKAHSSDLTTATNENSITINQVVSAISELARGNSEQSEIIANTNTTLTGIVKTIDVVCESTHENADKAKQSLEIVSIGQQAVDFQSERMKESISITNEVGVSIKELSEMIGEVGNIVDVITSIASQTNLLALNAAIEAARAGDAGKGFAVVSDEIRRLAERSASATKEITQIIQDTTVKSTMAVENMDKSKKIVDNQEQALNSTKDAFRKIKTSVEDIVQKTLHSAEVLQEVDLRSREVVEQSRNMTILAEGSAAGTEQISASSEEQLASIEMIANSAEILSDMAKELNNEITKFTF